MTDANERCKRSWEAEAVEDGRLAGDEAASFRRHAASCGYCRREQAALENLRRLGCAHRPSPSSELGRRRQRVALIAEANRRVFSEGAGVRGPLVRAAGAIAAAAVVVLAMLAMRAHSTRHPPDAPSSLAVTDPGYDVSDVDHARWSVARDGARTELRLTAGAARFHVDHLGAGQRFLVLLPDGELEVRGTRFLVRVEGARTTEVSVDEGLVALRLSGAPERMLAGGARWVPLVEPSVAAASPRSTELASDPTAKTAAAARARAARVASRSTAVSTSAVAARAPSPDATTGPDAKATFGDAMAAFSAGDYGRADAGFAAFLARVPGDGRREDAAFLRAVCHARRGDSAGAAALARAYLAAYPSGLRRLEARAIADASQ